MKSKRRVLLEIILVLGGLTTFIYVMVLWVGIAPLEARLAKEGQEWALEQPPEERGYASWYGRSFHGLRTQGGEHYDMHLYTAAHPTLPLDTWVRVTNLRNGKIVWVRINDRGPYHSDRIIDLSYRAAKDLEMVEEGTEEVTVEVVDWETTPKVEKPNGLPHHAPSAHHPSAHNSLRQV